MKSIPNDYICWIKSFFSMLSECVFFMMLMSISGVKSNFWITLLSFSIFKITLGGTLVFPWNTWIESIPSLMANSTKF